MVRATVPSPQLLGAAGPSASPLDLQSQQVATADRPAVQPTRRLERHASSLSCRGSVFGSRPRLFLAASKDAPSAVVPALLPARSSVANRPLPLPSVDRRMESSWKWIVRE